MDYTQEVLARRVKLARELTSARERPNELLALELSGPGRQLNIPFPTGLAPTTSSGAVGDPNAPLPRADVVVLTYTSDEGKALADVLTPGRFSSDWNHYTHNFDGFLPDIRADAPSRKAGRLASYWTSTVARKTVLTIKSELHLHQDFVVRPSGPTMPIKQFFAQIIAEAQPQYFFCIGTAGGTYLDKPLGTAAASRAVRFDCKSTFKNFTNTVPYKSEWTMPLTLRQAAVGLMGGFTSHLVIERAGLYGDCPCAQLQAGDDKAPAANFVIDGTDGVPAFFPVLTTDYFEFGTDANGLDKLGMAVEMDDAVLGLVCSEMPSPPKWASIRNYSDPAINHTLSATAQENCAGKIYTRYGYWTSVLGAIATWSIIAGL
jgi:hypothetical protein